MIDIKKDHGLLLSFVASLTACDNMNDVALCVYNVMDHMGYHVEVSSTPWDSIAARLHKEGVKTLNGFPVGDD